MGAFCFIWEHVTTGIIYGYIESVFGWKYSSKVYYECNQWLLTCKCQSLFRENGIGNSVMDSYECSFLIFLNCDLTNRCWGIYTYIFHYDVIINTLYCWQQAIFHLLHGYHKFWTVFMIYESNNSVLKMWTWFVSFFASIF